MKGDMAHRMPGHVDHPAFRHADPDGIALGHRLGIIGDEVLDFVNEHAPALNAATNSQRDRNFEFFGLRTVYDRYLLRHPETREVVETPQYFFLRVACGLSTTADEAVDLEYLADNLWFVGSPETVAGRIMDLQAQTGGFGYLTIVSYDATDEREAWDRSLQLLMTDVLPRCQISHRPQQKSIGGS